MARIAQRLGEWVGKGPVLEEDIALTNVGLDLLGQARLWFAYAGEIDAKTSGHGRTEDELAFLRDGSAFRNLERLKGKHDAISSPDPTAQRGPATRKAADA